MYIFVGILLRGDCGKHSQRIDATHVLEDIKRGDVEGRGRGRMWGWFYFFRSR